MDEWISVKDAAKIMSYTPAYFRVVFCNADNPLVTIRQRPTPSGRKRRILVSKKSIEELLNDEIKKSC